MGHRATTPPHLLHLTATTLNEYAAAIDGDRSFPGLAPSTPSFWFAGLADRSRDEWGTPERAALLSSAARRLLGERGIFVAVPAAA